jgi:integrase
VYARTLRKWCYPHPLKDGRELGDLPIDAVTREMLGAMVVRIRQAKRSRSVLDQVRFPLLTFYRDMIERKKLSGPNPAENLRHFVGKARAKSQSRQYPYFLQEEGPTLMAAAHALFSRWYPLILTGIKAGLRWGESAALRRTDVNFRTGLINVERTTSDRDEHQRVEPVKDYQRREVKASAGLLTVLRDHLEAMTLEASQGVGRPSAGPGLPDGLRASDPVPYFWSSVW